MLNAAGLEFLKRCGLSELEFLSILKGTPCPNSLVLGVIQTESSGYADAMRFEAKYEYVHDVERYARMYKWTTETELTLQKFSYGLMQIMLATARWRGFTHHPRRLLEPKTNVAWGVYHLHALYQQFKTWPDAVAAYNYGHPAKTLITKKYKNQEYVDRVYRHAASFQVDGEYRIT
jgi:soluble lytic murein transglycosylase-like protein